MFQTTDYRNTLFLFLFFFFIVSNLRLIHLSRVMWFFGLERGYGPYYSYVTGGTNQDKVKDNNPCLVRDVG